MLSPIRWLLRSLNVASKAHRARRRPGLALIESLESRQMLTTIFSEGFENGFFDGSDGWSVNSSQGRNWDNTQIGAHTGSFSCFSADLTNGSDQQTYVNNMDTQFSRTVDLSDFRNVSLSWWRFINTESSFDTFQVTVSKAGVDTVSSAALSGALNGGYVQDVLQIPESLWGQSGVTVLFKFHSDNSVVPGGYAGANLDDISMDGFFDPGFPESTISVPSGSSIRLNQFGDFSNPAFVRDISSAGEVDTYGFGVDTAGDYTITIAPTGGLDPQLRIYDAAGNALTGIIDGFGSNGTESFTINLPNSGEACYFRVGGFTSSTGNYTISITGPSSFVTSEAVPSPTYSVTDSSTLSFAGDRDYISFTAPLDTTVLSITLTPAAGLDSHLTLLDSNGVVLTTNDSGNSGQADSISSFPIIAGETYVLMVSGFSLSEGSAGSESYSYTIDFGPDNQGQPPSVITLPTTPNLRLNQFGDISGVAGNIGSTLDLDLFGFGVETTGSYTITAGGANSVDTELRIYDSNGIAITPIQDGFAANGTETITLNLTAGQTCYFAVGGFSSSTGSYTVSVDGPSVTVPASTLPSPNYFFAGSGAIGFAGNRDYFGVTAPVNTNVLSITLSPSAGLDGVISLFDAAGVLLLQRDNNFAGGAESIANFAVSAGTSYVVMFSGFDLTEGAGGSESYNYTLDFGPDLVDINVAPTIPAGQLLQLAENSAASASVGTVVANDANSTAPNNVLTYQILSGSPSNPFTINASTGAITYNGGPLSFETISQFTLSIRVTDGGNLFSTQNVTVAVTDVNEAPTIQAGQTFQVLENSAVNAVVGTVVASDPDSAAPNNTLTYQILSGVPSNPFSINAAGQITVSNPAALNFETTSQFTLQVRVTDGGAGNLNATQSVVINLIDQNEAPSITAGQIFNIAENSAANTQVGTVQASDPDAPGPNKTLTYTFTGGGNTNNAFAINSATGAITVNNALALDFETSQGFSLTVQVTDGGSLSASQSVTVNVTNVNESPVVAAGQSFNVGENSAAGTVVGTVVATDPDLNKTLTYSITGGNTGPAFAIDAATGAITVLGTLNFEAISSYSLTVRATDSGNLFDSKTVTVQVNNLNEAPTITAGLSFNVTENSAIGTVVGTATAFDPDANATVTFSITGGNTGTAFAIDATTGVITVAGAINFEATASYNLTVRATDNGNLFDSKTVTVQVNNLNETPTLTGGSGTVTFIKAQGTPVALMPNIIVADPDGPTDLGRIVVRFFVPRGGAAVEREPWRRRVLGCGE